MVQTRVAMYYRNSDVRLEEIPKPELEPGEILIRVMASGICGSDTMEWYRIKKAPLVLGHEIAGDVEKIGNGVDKFGIGDRVVVTHHVPCNECDYCVSGHHAVCETLRHTKFYPGGFAECVRVPKMNVDLGTFPLPDHVSYEDGSFVEPLGCVVRGMKLVDFRAGQSVAVFGSGIAGILNIKLARALSAGRIIATDVSRERLEAAKKFGADNTLSAEEDISSRIREITGSDGADLVIVATGALPAFHQAIASVDRGGTIMFFAPPKPDERVQLPVNQLWRNEVRMMTSYAAAPEDLEEALQLISSEKIVVEDMITHRLPLSETQRGFMLAERGGETLKVIIEPQK